MLSTRLDANSLFVGTRSTRIARRDGDSWDGEHTDQSRWSWVGLILCSFYSSCINSEEGARLGIQHLGKTLREMEPILHRLVRIGASLDSWRRTC